MNTHENWKKVEEFDNYSVSDLGNLRNDTTGRIFNGTVDAIGYKHVRLSKDGKYYLRKVHRLVATAFIPNPQNKPLVDHFNEEKKDNRACNLRWVTYKENLDAYLDRRDRKYGKNPVQRRVAQYDINGDLIAVYKNCRDASNKTGISYPGIYDAAYGKIRTCKNYVWRFLDDEPEQHIDFIKDGRLKRVMMTDGNSIIEFSSIKDAALHIENIGIANKESAYANISFCLHGKTKTAYGFKFEYV
jgi:hypothetical protein